VTRTDRGAHRKGAGWPYGGLGQAGGWTRWWRAACTEPQDRVQLDGVGCNTTLSMVEVKETNTRNLHLGIHPMPRTGGMELGGELAAYVADTRQERTRCSHTLGSGYLRDHGSPFHPAARHANLDRLLVLSFLVK
jgi:hypothetical protein